MSVSTKTLQVLNILGLLLVLLFNYLANALPVGGRTTGEVAAIFDNLFVPAGYAFTIWGLIYLLLIVFVVRQARGLFGRKEAPAYVDRIGPWFFVSCLANALWILTWHNLQVILAMLLMLIILGSLLSIYLRLDISYPQPEVPFFVRLPFSVYLGWITVATIANAAALLVYLEWNAFGIPEPVWTVNVIGVAALIGVFIVRRRLDVPFVLVLLWALFAILVRREAEGTPEGNTIVYAVYIAIALLVGGTVSAWVRR